MTSPLDVAKGAVNDTEIAHDSLFCLKYVKGELIDAIVERVRSKQSATFLNLFSLNSQRLPCVQRADIFDKCQAWKSDPLRSM